MLLMHLFAAAECAVKDLAEWEFVTAERGKKHLEWRDQCGGLACVYYTVIQCSEFEENPK